MKLKSLILGSVAAAGLSTAGFAADLGVLTSLDVCDSLGISGLTISSADNCLAISGKVSYEFNWGDFNNNWRTGVVTNAGTRNVAAPGSFLGTPAVNGQFVASGAGGYPAGTVYEAAAADNPADTVNRAPVAAVAADATRTNDWNSKVESWLKFVGTASSDFGPASATIKIKNIDQWTVTNEAAAVAGGDHNGGNIVIDEAFVQVGDTTTIMAGKKGSIFKKDDDEPFNWLGLYGSDAVDKGVGGTAAAPAGAGLIMPATGGHVIQVVSSLGNGVTVKGGLEKLDAAGTAVGVIEYAGQGITAHLSAAAGGILRGTVSNWGIHAGFTGTFDAFKVRAAGAFTSDTTDTYYNVLGSAQATFDMFTIALSGEASGGSNAARTPSQVGFGGSVGATVTEGVKINLGGKWFDTNTAVANTEHYQIAAQIVAAVTETVTLTGEVGVNGDNVGAGASDFYGKAELGWKPGGQFESSVGAQIQQNGAYKVTFKASKEFK
ncbi:hypothetical protein [Devosia faecipullorum]|uniref:hypothetical protein n=1 Tax=Devosia faecipullorum TaxID=2755039 RepID=UPI00187B4978|nr:hypothetical protein [Devosia faecipullorum]MBE7734480.1 hypothetical protein [Devosia faecipullorum]